jgi:hypothetical protein
MVAPGPGSGDGSVMNDVPQDVHDGARCDTCGHAAVGACAGCGAPLCVDCLYEDSQCRWYESIDRPDHSAAFEPHCGDDLPSDEWPTFTCDVCHGGFEGRNIVEGDWCPCRAGRLRRDC